MGILMSHVHGDRPTWTDGLLNATVGKQAKALIQGGPVFLLFSRENDRSTSLERSHRRRNSGHRGQSLGRRQG